MTKTFIHRLHGRHALLEAALHQEMRRATPCSSILATIKKRKLQLKDRLRSLEFKATTEGLG